MKLHLRATGCHSMYIADTSEHTPHNLPTPEGWKAELT